MWLFLSSVLMATLLSGAAADSQHRSTVVLMDNVLVGTIPYKNATSHIPLTCGSAHQHKAVFWKRNGEEIQPSLLGEQVSVEVIETVGGNFSCHLSSSGDYLNHTLVLIQVNQDEERVILDDQGPGEGAIHCWASNYNGSFRCTWIRNKFRNDAYVLMVKAQRMSQALPCQWDPNGSEASCQDSACSYREEEERVSVSVYMVSSFMLEIYTKSFYLRDIVRPEAVGVHAVGGKRFQWSYPESWQRPCTFFGLAFQVKVVGGSHSCNTQHNILTAETDASSFLVDVRDANYTFCVRGQDKHTRGPWGPWSQCRMNGEHAHCGPVASHDHTRVT
ncbi:interleukin-12 subunit beta [Festucalex cinctus]